MEFKVATLCSYVGIFILVKVRFFTLNNNYEVKGPIPCYLSSRSETMSKRLSSPNKHSDAENSTLMLATNMVGMSKRRGLRKKFST